LIQIDLKQIINPREKKIKNTKDGNPFDFSQALDFK
jgi:hypothetical protein